MLLGSRRSLEVRSPDPPEVWSQVRRGLPTVVGMSEATDRPRFEYSTVPLLTHATKQILDTWGEDGWELVSVVPGPNPENVVAYMKREK